MKKVLFFGIAAGVVLIGCKSFGSSLIKFNNSIKLKYVDRIVYFDPEVFPDYDGIKAPTNLALYAAVSDELKKYGNYKIMHINDPVKYDSINSDVIKELCINNGAEVAIVPKVKYFKVGLGKYVFSNQVIISIKLYNNDGNLVIENSYDTYKGSGRLLGSAENSVKIGTSNVIKNMISELRNKNTSISVPKE
jgi:hypothetical protein